MRARLPLLLAGALLLGSAQALAGQICAVDLDGNGDATEAGEVAACTAAQDGAWICPLHATSCEAQAPATDGAPVTFACPLGSAYRCAVPAEGGTPVCSPGICVGSTGDAVVDEPVVDDPGAPADGSADADGNCLGTIEIFAGRALRCRPPGAKTSLSNCCKDRGEIVRDGMGSSISSLSTKIAVAKSVFTGMKAAYAAYQAGATAGAAASAGANAMIVGIDPTSIAISIAVNLMIEVLLQGCDQQDMETGMLRGSGMCHEVGTYCASSILGVCIQKAKSHCCFNTRLGRILQEQGRPQLRSFNAIGWGPVRHPICRGFTPEEFQALDFSKIDLSEYYAEIDARSQTLIQTDMKEHVDAYLHDVAR